MSSAGVPSFFPIPKDNDDDDVVWAMQTALVQWNRGGKADAVVWIRRAADSADGLGQKRRATELRHQAALLAERMWDDENVEEAPVSLEVDVGYDSDIPRALSLPPARVVAPPVGSLPAPPLPLRAPSLSPPPFPALSRSLPPRSMDEGIVDLSAGDLLSLDDDDDAPRLSVHSISDIDELRSVQELAEEEQQAEAEATLEQEQFVDGDAFDDWDDADEITGEFGSMPEAVSSLMNRPGAAKVKQPSSRPQPAALVPTRPSSIPPAPGPLVPVTRSSAPPPPAPLVVPRSMPPAPLVPTRAPSIPPLPAPLVTQAPMSARLPPVPAPPPLGAFPPILQLGAPSEDDVEEIEDLELRLDDAGPGFGGDPLLEDESDEDESDEDESDEDESDEDESDEDESDEDESDKDPLSAAPIDLVPSVVAFVPEEPASTQIDGYDLAAVTGFEDMPLELQSKFAASARIDALGEEEEVGHFGAALVTSGRVKIAPAISDLAGAYATPGQVIFTRGSLSGGMELRVVAAEPGTRVVSWNNDAIDQALVECPWVAEDLRALADRFHALCGATLGVLGEGLDESLVIMATERMQVVRCVAGDVLLEAGSQLPGLYIVAAGKMELLNGDKTVEQELAPGDIVYASEEMSAKPAPKTVAAAASGALLLFAPRALAHELITTIPPLLEVLTS